MNSDEATAVIASCLHNDNSSALFRHEIAYVLGQLEKPVATRALCEVLARQSENKIVRHEAAEALGAIGTPECIAALEKHIHDDEPAVAGSCVVALDVVNYWALDGGEGGGEGEGKEGVRMMSKSAAAAVFAEPLRCSCTTRVVPRT